MITGKRRGRGAAGILLGVCCAAVPACRLLAQGPVRVAGYLQPRFESVGDSALFFLRRARVGIQGDITPWARFRAQIDIRNLGVNGTPSSVVGTDLYVALTPPGGRWIFTVGQAKLPFSLEEIMGSSTLPLPDRSIVVGDDAPNRDIGASAEWHPARALDVQGGVYDGEGPNHASNPDKKMLYLGRIAVTPLEALELSGAGAAYPDSTWWDVAGVAHHGPWLVRAEWLRRSRRGTGDRLSGWYALASYLIAPNRVQLVARVEQVDPTSAPLDRETGYTAGAQYLIKGDDLKVQGSYEVFAEEGPAVGNNRFIVQLQARW